MGDARSGLGQRRLRCAAEAVVYRPAPLDLHGLLPPAGLDCCGASGAIAAQPAPVLLALLFGGGVFYTVGAVIYATKCCDFWPQRFGFHEIFHLFVSAGGATRIKMQSIHCFRKTKLKKIISCP